MGLILDRYFVLDPSDRRARGGYYETLAMSGRFAFFERIRLCYFSFVFMHFYRVSGRYKDH